MEETRKFKVAFWEFERGWGSKIDSYEEFDTEELANARIQEFNADNNLDEVPDWYMTARPFNF